MHTVSQLKTLGLSHNHEQSRYIVMSLKGDGMTASFKPNMLSNWPALGMLLGGLMFELFAADNGDGVGDGDVSIEYRVLVSLRLIILETSLDG